MSCVYAQAVLDHDPPTDASHVASITDMCTTPGLLIEMRFLLTFCPKLQTS
jgi:hypothetical protein